MEKTQIQKELYELELRKVALESEIKQFEVEEGSVKDKKVKANFGGLSSALLMFVPGVNLLWGAGGMFTVLSLHQKYDKEVSRLKAEIDRREKERRLVQDRIYQLQAELSEEQQKELRSRLPKAS